MNLKVLLVIVFLVPAIAYGLAGFRDDVSVRLDVGIPFFSGNNFAYAETGNSVLAIIPSRDARFVSGVTVEMTQEYGSSFIIAFTNGTADEIAEKELSKRTKHFGKVNELFTGSEFLSRDFIRLEYLGIDIISRIRWSTGMHEILVTNIGTSSNPVIQMEVVE